jgi:hypothetical protein
MEAQGAAQQLAQAAAQQAVLGCRSPVSVLNITHGQMDAHCALRKQLLSSWHKLAHREPSVFVIVHASYLLFATYIQGCGH